jgi:hypothetical protein
MAQISEAFRAIVWSLPGQVRRPHEISKAFGLDKALGWKLGQLIDTTDTIVAGRHLPGSSAMQIILTAAKKAGVSSELITKAGTAVEQVDDLIRVHAGDRATLDAMWAGLISNSVSADPNLQIEHRRAAFRGNSFTWGIQAGARLISYFWNNGSDVNTLDLVALTGFVGLRGLRPHVPWTVTRSSITDCDGELRSVVTRQPLDPDAATDTVPLIDRFCSKPLPEFRRTSRKPGFVDEEVIVSRSGNTGATTFFAAEVMRNVTKTIKDEHNQYCETAAALWTPCETVILDFIVHESVFGPLLPELQIISELGAAGAFPAHRDDRYALPCSERVTYLGKGHGVLGTPAVPRYSDLGKYVFERLGWESARFDVYRALVRFPPIPATIVMRHPLRS